MVFGDNHGGDALVGRRDANWARGNSAVTNVLLLSAVWVLGAVFADRNAPALGGILNQQGVGSSTIKILLVLVQIKYCLSNGKLIDASFT